MEAEGEARFKLLCVYDGAAIIKAWPVITEGIEIMLENAGSDTSMDKIFNDLMAGRLLLWIALLDGAYMGFVTTQVVELPPTKKHLWIVHAYKTIKTPTVWMMRAYEELERFAVAHKCNSVRFYGLRKKWQERFLPLGFKEGYVEFAKEL
jgi:hypothetical protein